MRDALGTVQTVLLLGGTSEIGLAIAEQLARPRAATVVLAGRDSSGMDSAADRLRQAGAGRVETLAFDATDTASHEDTMAEAARRAGADIDVVVVAFGLLGNQELDEAGGDGAVRVATTNYVGAVSAGLAAAHLLKAQGHGALVALSSVAGERVRRANFIYGSSKAGMDGFFQGLADSLAGTGVRVLIVRPGFVRTRMTEGMTEAPMAATAEQVAAATVQGLRSGRSVVWVPAPLRLVFAVFRHLPRPVWRRIPA
ncbi:MAG TPA: decaprenylphospho-beta-D-erythro-pentofuranosid-2-ulose 2-reductase [Acidimicrobiales bacterium]|nr:decaprenylphospho-beta-D-erythro-pentofuranosid-2-ulose 2-reductase [Acidimicrobiales bacterium]